MNQTEIPNVLTVNQNVNTSNLNQNSNTAIAPKITIFSNTSNHHNQSQDSKSKIVRVSSSKGIRVLSKQSSQQKISTSQFQLDKQKSQTQLRQIPKQSPQSSTSIKMEETNKLTRNISVKSVPQYLQEKMRGELMSAISKYQSKMNQQLSFQYNTYLIESQKLEEKLKKSEQSIRKKQVELQEMGQRVKNVEDRVNKKIGKIQASLQNFQTYYSKCNEYAFNRVAQLQIKAHAMFEHIEKSTNPQPKIETWQYLESAYQTIKNITLYTAMKSSAIKLQTDDELYQLQIRLGSALSQIQKLELNMLDYMNSIFNKDHIKQTMSLIENMHRHHLNTKQQLNQVQTMQEYENKFQSILKKVNKTSIEVQLTKAMMGNINSEELKQTIQKLEKQIDFLRRGLGQKQQKLKKRQSQLQEYKALQFSNQELLHKLSSAEIKMKQLVVEQSSKQQKINQITKKLNYYQIKHGKSANLQINLQTSLAEAYCEAMIQEKIKKIQQQNEGTSQQQNLRIKQLQQRIQKLDSQNYLLAQKLSQKNQSSDLKVELRKASTQLDHYRKINHELEEKLTNISESMSEQQKVYMYQSKQNQQEIKSLSKQVQKLKDEISKSKQQKQQLLISITQRKEEIEDEEYDQLANKYSKKELLEHIETLEEELADLAEENINIKHQKEELGENLEQYANTFQKQSLTFKCAIESLEKDKIKLMYQLEKLQHQNSTLKEFYSEYQSSTVQSFYEQNKNKREIHLRKTCSTQLTGHNQPEHFYRKFSKQETRESSGYVTPKNRPQLIQANTLKEILKKRGFSIPLLCSIDKSGCIVNEDTGQKIIDDNGNRILMDNDQLREAILSGIIVL